MNLQKTCFLAIIHSFTLLAGHKIQSHTYAIEKQRQIINKDEQFSARSSIQCAAECSENAFCCTGTFDYQTKQCSISMNCFPETEVAANGFMFTNVQRKENIPLDCSDVPDGSSSGVYWIYPSYTSGIVAYCEMETEHGGWTVFQRRLDGTTDFYRDWAEYKAGFGDVYNEYWLGNDNLNILAFRRNYQLRVEMEYFNGTKIYAVYSTFYIGNESTNYNLTVNGYSGNAGDALAYNNGMQFSTKDRDNDDFGSAHCARDIRKSGWWFYKCTFCNLNGLYKPGVSAEDAIFWQGSTDLDNSAFGISLKKTRMMIK